MRVYYSVDAARLQSRVLPVVLFLLRKQVCNRVLI